ncbi:MAG: hypothetical protein DLM52_10330 [Chthoniobacterales bacterium]|nr:MAG: hypothetical protein DLM52_10330 [Chthoniobacterales bacterium]
MLMKDLPIYLKDHLAGSVGALDMLDHMIDAHEGKPLEAFLRTLRVDIDADQNELKRLMKHLEVDESAVRNAGAWVAEKFSRVKLRIGDAGDPNLALLQSLESLVLGITGKRSLWRNLGAVKKEMPRLTEFDFDELEKRAVDQFERVEEKAREVARQIFMADLLAEK